MTRAPYQVMRTCLSWIQPHPHGAILRHILNTVNSFLCSSTNYFENWLLPNDLIIVRDHGDDKEDEWDIKRALERQGDAHIVTKPPLGGSLSTMIILSDSRWSENTINTHEYNAIYWSSSIIYYKLGSHFKYTKGLKPKDASKDISEFAEASSLTFSTFSSP
jgi:hypothetical protein